MTTHWGTAPAKRPFPSDRELRGMESGDIELLQALSVGRVQFLRDKADAHEKFAKRCGRELDRRTTEAGV